MIDKREIRFLIFLLDGMADWPCDELEGKTPLEAADIPLINRLVKEGAMGRLKTVPERAPDIDFRPGLESGQTAGEFAFRKIHNVNSRRLSSRRQNGVVQRQRTT